MPHPQLSEWLREEPFALAMSAGFFGFFAHCGVLTVLEDAGLLPARVSGASAGALVVGGWAAGIDARRLGDELLRLKRDDFWDPRPGPGLLRGHLFRAKLESLLPVTTFAQCRVPITVSAYDVVARRARGLADGKLAQAIHASCAVPMMFHPVWIGGRPFVDGGVADRPGLAGMPAAERVLFHHLASRSPWRRVGSASTEIPHRVRMTSVTIDAVPRVGPFRLAQGALAFEAGRRGMARALTREVAGPIVRV